MNSYCNDGEEEIDFSNLSLQHLDSIGLSHYQPVDVGSGTLSVMQPMPWLDSIIETAQRESQVISRWSAIVKSPRSQASSHRYSIFTQLLHYLLCYSDTGIYWLDQNLEIFTVQNNNVSTKL